MRAMYVTAASPAFFDDKNSEMTVFNVLVFP